MKHDEKQLLEFAISAFSDIEHSIKGHPNLSLPVRAGVKGCIANACKDYAEHQNRWRPISERPEIGQRIEVAYRCEADWADDWSSVEVFDREFLSAPDIGDESDKLTGKAYAWRPVSGLPETSA